MNWTKLSIGTLLGGVAYFFMGWAVYGLLLRNLFVGHELRSSIAYAEEDFKIGLMVLSCLAMGAFLSFIFIKWAGISTFVSGAKGGAIIAAFMSLIAGSALAAEYKVFDIQTTLYSVGADAICAAMAGGLIGWYLGRDK